jgi:hypothetical protein
MNFYFWDKLAMSIVKMRTSFYGAILPFLFVPVLLLVSSSPEDPLARIVAGFARYLEQLPQEKVYVHLDRPYYSSGETIWLKTYLTAGPYHEPSPFSLTIYVELINDRHQLVQQVKLQAVNGSAAGNISIPDSVTSGNYLIRAYTNWMRNTGEAYFYHRPIRIWSNSNAAANSSQQKTIDVQFFPEGGDLVKGILSKVAFKSIGPDGLGKKIAGKILDQTKVVCEFQSNSLGMGIFHIVPEPGKQYRAIVEGTTKEFLLPPPKDEGLVMTVINAPKSNDIVLKAQVTDFRNIRTIFIVAQTRGVVCYSARADLSTNIAVAKIPKASFPSGIAQITITDINGSPLAERLIFMDAKDQLTLSIKVDKSIYAPRELVKLDIDAKDADGKPVVADLSLAVCDNQQVLIDENRETINTYLLLSSELIGNIETPGYYFNTAIKDRDDALDHLLLTQGWRRFTMKKALEEKWEPPSFNVEQGLTIKGRLVNLHNDKPVAEGKVSYLSIYPIPETRTATTNEKGEFEFKHIAYFDSTQAMLQGETKKGSKAVKVIVDSTVIFPQVSFPVPRSQQTQSDFEKAFVAKQVDRENIARQYNEEGKAITLEAIEIEGKKDETEKLGSKVYGSGTKTINVAGEVGLENLLHPLQLVQGRVAGVQVTGNGMSWSVKIRGVSSINSGTTPLIMIDDIPVGIETLQTLSVQDVASVTVWKGPDAAIFGARAANGVIGFYTKKGAVRQALPVEGRVNLIASGFQTERQFYAPKYDVQKPEHSTPDKRITLFWAPYIQTDSTGHASIEFYNHDEETSITGVIEGITTSGRAGAASFSYRINK